MLLLSLWMGVAAHADGPSTFTCCDDPVVEQVVEAWLDAGEALNRGGSHREPLGALAKAAKGRAPTDAAPVLERIAAQAKRLSSLPLASARAEVQPLASDVVWLALRHESGSLDVVQASCAGQGSWLQRRGKKVRNPSGASCGTLR